MMLLSGAESGNLRAVRRSKGFGMRLLSGLLGVMLIAACSPDESISTSSEAPDVTSPDENTGTQPDSSSEGTGATASPDEAREIVISYSADITGLDPQISSGSTTQAIVHHNVYEGLVRVDGTTGELIPVLATEWQNVDETTWRVALREGVAFHNGEPFNADAVVYSVTRIMDEGTQSEFRGYFPAGLAATPIDEYTVELRTTDPSPVLPRLLNFLMIVPPTHAQSSAEALQAEPVGTGPYKVTSASANEVSVEGNPDYWGDPVAVDRFRIIAQAEPTVRTIGVQTGEIDIAVDIPPQSMGEVPATTVVPGQELMLLRLNGLVGITQDAAAREAIVLGTDRDLLRTSLLGDEQSSPAQGQYASGPAVFGYDPDMPPQPFDPDRARQLLEESGHAGDSFRLLGVAGRFPQGEEFVEALALNLEENTGLDVQLEILDFASWLDVLIGDPAEDTSEGVFMGVSADQFDLSQVLAAQVREGAVALRFPHDDYPQVQELIEQSDRALDPAEREALLQEISREVVAAHYIDTLYRANTIWGHQEDVAWTTSQAPRIDLATVVVES